MPEYRGMSAVGVPLYGIEELPPDDMYVHPYLVIGPRVGDAGSMSLVWVYGDEEYSSSIEFNIDDGAFDVLDGYVDLCGAFKVWVDTMFANQEDEA